MPLEMQDATHLKAAHGYIELGMWSEANAELEEIDAFCRHLPEILAARLEIYHVLKKWELMAEMAKRLAEFQPNGIQWIVSYAYATRRADCIETAKEILLKAESRFPKEAIIKYNLGCYECQLGNLEAAKNYLKNAFELDSNWRAAALDDLDLERLWETLKIPA